MIPLKIPIRVADYDRRHDVLHVHFAGALHVSDDEDFPGIYVRRAMPDDRIVGIMVMDFCRRRQFVEQALGFVDWAAVDKAISERV